MKWEVLNGNINWQVSANAANTRRWADSGHAFNSDVPEQNLPPTVDAHISTKAFI